MVTKYLNEVRELFMIGWWAFVIFRLLDVAEELQTDARRDNQQSHGEEYEGAKFLGWAEYLKDVNRCYVCNFRSTCEDKLHSAMQGLYISIKLIKI